MNYCITFLSKNCRQVPPLRFICHVKYHLKEYDTCWINIIELAPEDTFMLVSKFES